MKHCFAILVTCLLFAVPQLGHSQIPVAGMDSLNRTITIAPWLYGFQITVPNTASGTIQSWRYILRHTMGPPVTDVTLTNAHAAWTYNYTAPGPNTRLRLMQIVTNTFGSDSVEFEFNVDCSVVVPAISYGIQGSISGGTTSFCAITTDYFTERDLDVNGQYLTSVSLGYHAQTSCGTDTFSLPCLVTVCGLFTGTTCNGPNHTTCATYNIPCWRDPVVSISSQVTGQQVQYQSTAIATAGATYAWDFGDGNSSASTSPSHTYAQPGAYTACLTVTDTCGVTTLCETVYVGVTATAMPAIVGLRCFPNPSNGQFQLRFEGKGVEDYIVEIMDLRGRVLHQEAWSAHAGQVDRNIAADLSKGIYLLELRAASGERQLRKLQIE